MWDVRFASFRVWQACKRGEPYKENWIAWHDLERAKRVETFQFLEAQLRRATLSVAVPSWLTMVPETPSAGGGGGQGDGARLVLPFDREATVAGIGPTRARSPEMSSGSYHGRRSAFCAR
jgi:hypothetical protein